MPLNAGEHTTPEPPGGQALELKLALADEAVTALNLIGEDLLAKAVDLAPIEEGTLRGSAALALIVNGRSFEGEGALAATRAEVARLIRAGADVSIDAEVSFNTVYAARQHEETTWHHPLGGQAHYLSEPLMAGIPRYNRIIELGQRKVTARA